MPAAQYARRVDRLCGEVARKVVEAGVQKRLSQIDQSGGTEEEKLRRAAPILAEQLRRIAEFRRKVELVGMPSAHRDDAELLLDKARSAETELENAVASAQEGDSAKAREAIARYYGFSMQSASIARDSKLNFAICGAGT